RTQDGLPMGLRYTPDRLNTVFIGGLSSAFLYMHLAATTLGLASQWVSTISTPLAHCMVKDLLGIPKTMDPYDMMALGYPAMTPSDKFMRDPKKMVHHDYCGTKDFRSDKEVRDFVKRARNWTIGAHRKKAH
ncbi:MAG: nitroreductase family protein, partial [Pseudomonadota bacterium]